MPDTPDQNDEIFPRRQRRRGQLHTLDDVERTLGYVVRAVRHGRIKPAAGGAMVGALKLLVSVFEARDRDKRLTAVEEAVARMRKGEPAK